MPVDLSGRVALVTGAGHGIGRAIAITLAAAGARVAVVDLDGDAVRQVTGELGSGATGHVVDLADRVARADLVPAVLGAHGRLDVLVNNAAYHGLRVPALDVDQADWDLVLETNLTATAVLSQAAARHMVGRGGGGRSLSRLPDPIDAELRGYQIEDR